MSDIKQEIKDKAILSVADSKRPKGGQHCGMERRAIVLESKELDFKISFGYYRSQHKNRQIISDLFDLLIDEVVKTK